MSQITSRQKVSRVVSSERHPKSWDTHFARKQNVSCGMQTSTHVKITGLTGSLRQALQTDGCGQKLVRETSSTVTSRQQTDFITTDTSPSCSLFRFGCKAAHQDAACRAPAVLL